MPGGWQRWPLVVGLPLTLNVRHERQQAAETALTQARSDFQRDVIYRHWNAKYGPLYVPVGKGVAPNPYLAGTPDRDITTTKGKVLTLVNPACTASGCRSSGLALYVSEQNYEANIVK